MSSLVWLVDLCRGAVSAAANRFRTSSLTRQPVPREAHPSRESHRPPDRMPRHRLRDLFWLLLCCSLMTGGTATVTAAEPVSLFDGKSFDGWEGDTQQTWRIEDQVIVGGSLEKTVPRNEFLSSKKEYSDFELQLEYKLVGTEGFVNGGVQIRSQRIPQHHEMIGYQADLGMGYDGALYDESRRNKMLAQPAKELLDKILKPQDWNDYRIRCEGKRIRLWLNGTLTVDYTESQPEIPLKGLIALQIHGGCKAVVRFRNIRLTDLTAADAAGAKKVSLFDGRSLDGWTGEAKELWRVADGAIEFGTTGKSPPRENWLTTNREFDNFDLSFRARLTGHVGTGLFFRSEKKPGQRIVGWQSDIGENYDGGLFKEGPNGGMIAYPDKGKIGQIVRTGEWNRYRIRAEGRRIRTWVNDQLINDFVDRDPQYRRSGVIALEMSPYGNGIARFQDLELIELPTSDADDAPVPTQVQERMTERLSSARGLPPLTPGQFALLPNEVVVFTGPENMVIEQQNGWLESFLTAGFAREKPRFRHMGFEGDTVLRQNRMMNWGTWQQNLDAAGATLVVAWFGQLEAFDPNLTSEQFATAYGQLLDQYHQRTKRLVVLSPLPFERPSDARVPDNRSRNARVRELAQIAQRLAKERGAIYVDLEPALAARGPDAAPLTRDGLHLTPDGSREVARLIAIQLGLKPSDSNDDSVRRAIVEKNRLWFDTWRCMNWAFAYGDRTTQPFAREAGSAPPFVQELNQFRPLVAHADATIAALSLQQPLPPPLPAPPARSDPPAVSADEERSRFKLRDGFDINLFADESLDVVRPVQIRWDEQGRLWVLCVPSYPQLQPGQTGKDYLIRLEDTNADGRADRSVRVAENLLMPMGFEFGDGGIYVCESTQVAHLTDSDGDGKMDRRRVVLSGFGTGDSHQNINSIRWGADGHLWFSQGYHIWSYVETPYGVTELNRSGIWRFNPRTLKLDSYLNESTAGLNCWGVAFDDYGQVFHASGADFVIWHTTPALIPTLHPLGLGAGLAGSRGKSMEPEFLGSSHLPPELQGALLKSTYFTNQVQLYRLQDQGAGYTSTDLGDLLSSTGTEFRPLETRVGPDGAIYICDWLNPVIGHYQASYRDPRRDLSHGRIWRMTAQGRPLLPNPQLGSLSLAQQIDRLTSPERWIRDQAQFALYRAPREAVLAALDARLQPLVSAKAPPDADGCRLLYQMSGVYAAHEAPRPALIAALFSSSDFHWRAWATRLVGLWANGIDQPLNWVTRAAEDEHPRVRLEAVVAASQIDSPQAVRVATLVLERPLDQPINYALTQCIYAQAARWKPALAAGQLDFGPRVHALARLLTTVGDQNIVGQVRELLQSKSLSPGARDSLLATLIENGSPADVEFAIQQAPDSPIVLEALTAVAFRRRDEGYGKVLETLLTSPYPAGRLAGCRVAATWGRDFGQLPRIVAMADSPTATPRERGAAILALSRIKGREVVPDLSRYAASNDPVIRIAALEALVPFEPGLVAKRVLQLTAETRSMSELSPLLQPLISSRTGPAQLTKAIREQRLENESARKILQWLGENGQDQPELQAALYQAAGFETLRFEYSPELVQTLLNEARQKGQADAGAKIFRSQESTCLKCHRLGEDGGKAGPDLTAIGRAMTPELIVESVFWPRRQIKEGFSLTTVVNNQGQVQSGYKEQESQTELVLRDPLSGQRTTFLKADLEERSDNGTLMPEGLTDPLSRQDRLHLIRFLIGLGR